MNLPVWVWQFDNAYPGAVGPDDSALPFSDVFVKALDGGRWQSAWDTHPAAISLAAQLAAVRDGIYTPQGIGVAPWAVVKGDDPNGEGSRLGAAAAALDGTIIVDLEPDEHGNYWQAGGGAAGGEAVGTLISSALAAGARDIWCAPDARPGRLAPVAFGSWVASPVTTRCLPQVYWTDFYKWSHGGDPALVTAAEARLAIDVALAELALFGWRTHATIAPIFPGDSAPEVMVAAIEYAASLGLGKPSIWQRGNLRADTAAAVAAMADPWEAVEPLTPHEIRNVRELLRRGGLS